MFPPLGVLVTGTDDRDTQNRWVALKGKWLPGKRQKGAVISFGCSNCRKAAPRMHSGMRRKLSAESPGIAKSESRRAAMTDSLSMNVSMFLYIS
jgi:hypothetical protein